MGEVYRAEDTKLGREVAIKVLPEAVANDPERLARFEREAKVLASLNHSSIAAIYSLEAAEWEGASPSPTDEDRDVGAPLAGARSINFLVMELAEGEDLKDRMERGPLPIAEALPIALQIAEAFEAAHERGIIHRDLKPANIKVGADDKVKVLDFGLAKALDPTVSDVREPLAGSQEGASPSPTPLSMSPTLTAQMTQAGVLMGTAAYMSPEQARGKEVDKRADIWAFGCVLYEMLTGQKGFAGDTVSDTLAAVLTRDLELSQLPDTVPPGIRQTLTRCLDKDSNRRLRDIGEARIAIEASLSGEDEAASVEIAAAPPRKGLVPVLVGLSIVAAAVAAYLGWRLKPSTEVPLRKLDLQTWNLTADWLRHPLISPDGSKVLFAQEGKLWVRELDQVDAREIPDSLDPYYFCWSPDSQQIAFISGARVLKTPAAGGAPTPIASLPGDVTGSGGLAWTPEGHLMITGGVDTGILQVSEQGGEFQEIVSLDLETDRDFHEIALLPEGRGIVYIVHREDPSSKRRIVDTLEVFAHGERQIVLRLEGESIQSVAYSPSGHLLFHRSTTTPGVWALPFSLSELKAAGDPFLVAANAWLPSAATDGTLTMVQGLSMAQREVVEVDRQGEVLRSFGHVQGELEGPDLSPDGKRLLVSAVENGNWDVWIYDLDGSSKSRFTFDGTFDAWARWSPSGKEVLYVAADTQEIRLKPVDGSGEEKRLAQGTASAWIPDGSGIVFERYSRDTKSWDLFYLLLSAGEAVPFLSSPANEGAATVSPNGRFLAYVSDETGREEVYIREFPQGEGKWQVSIAGGNQPVWAPAGREIFYLQADQMMAVEILDTEPVSLGRPQSLFSLQGSSLDFGFVSVAPFEVGPNGQTFILGRAVPVPGRDRKLVVVQNWYSEFDKTGR